MRKMVVLLAGTLMLASCNTAPPPPPAVAIDPNNPLFAPGYLAAAGSSDQFEIQSANLAMQMSQNPGVRNFSNMLIADHSRSTQMLMAAAQSAHINPPPPGLLPEHQAMLSQLQASGSGQNFDMTFKNLQIQAHEHGLTLHQNYATSGDVPALRATAAQIVPVVQMHLSQAQMLNVAPPPPPPPPPAPAPGRAGERG